MKPAARDTCRHCWWYKEFPWYVRRRDGYCSHPLVKSDKAMRLYTDAASEACDEFLSALAVRCAEDADVALGRRRP